jgi:hypothetical protein
MADEIEPCRIWKTDAKFVTVNNQSVTLDSYRAGGKYQITNLALDQIKNLNPRRLVKLTNWLVEKRHMGSDCPLIDSEAVENALSQAVPTVSQRRDKLLLWLYKNSDQLGQQFYLGGGGGRSGEIGAQDKIRDEFVLAYTSCLDTGELIKLVEFARIAGLVNCDPPRRMEPTDVSLSFSGYEKVNELLFLSVDSQQAFVAMWFDDEMVGVYDQAIAPAILTAGYSPIVINKKEHNNQIVEEIIAEIRRSRFVVADFTCGIFQTNANDPNGNPIQKEVPRGGVYFEAGFAKGLGREVIWTVRKDRLKFVHFDAAQFNFIVWENFKELKDKLAVRISATLGDGPLKKSS